MKKIIFTLFLLMPFVSGCSNVNANIEFLNPQNVFFTARIESEDKIPNEEVRIIKDNYKKFIDDDYITDVAFSKDSAKIEAIKLSKNIKRNDIDLSSLGFKTRNKSGRFIDVKHNFFVTLYNVDLVYNLNSQADKVDYSILSAEANEDFMRPEYLQKYAKEDVLPDSPEKSEEEDFQANFESNPIAKSEASGAPKTKVKSETEEDKDYFDINNLNANFSVTLPSRASFDNADKVSDNTYYWNINPEEKVSIKLQYIVYNSWAIAGLLLLVFGFLYLLARKILKHDAQKRIGTNN